MTTEKMPDVIWADGFNDWFSKPRLESDPIGFKRDKYLRAEHVEELMKQARDALDNIARDMYDDSEIRPILTAIDKFLGEK